MFPEHQLNSEPVGRSSGCLGIWLEQLLLRNLLIMAHTGVSLAVVDNPSLEDLAGLSRLTSISGDLQIYRLPLITSLAALSNLTAVGLNLVVGDMDGLTTLRGLSELLQSGRSLILHVFVLLAWQGKAWQFLLVGALSWCSVRAQVAAQSSGSFVPVCVKHIRHMLWLRLL
jgi:hypothetical protein